MNHADKVAAWPLVAPGTMPILDSAFRPAVLATQAFRQETRLDSVPVTVALERDAHSISRFTTEVLPSGHPQARANFPHLERWLKFLLWSRGGGRIHFAGPVELGHQLQKHYRESAVGKFDAWLMGRVYERPFELDVTTPDRLPQEREPSTPLGRHWDGRRIGFDLGASDRKVAAVRDGETVFSEEVAWNPKSFTDPQQHFDGIMDSLKRAAAHLPRVDAIGGSSAGVYVNNLVKVASLFRGVPEELFKQRGRDIFVQVKRAWNGIPLEVVNDGEVTALAGAMALKENAVLGIALGSSEAAGYVTPEGNITAWLNELAFAPVDYNPAAPADEWSGDRGCGAQYFSQQCVDRLLPVAGIELDPKMPVPEKLVAVQALMAQGDERAARIYHTIGAYLGYAIAHYCDFYTVRHLLILGRVTSGAGGAIILEDAKKLLRDEFPGLRVQIHSPDEKEKRHGQAMAAASLPQLSQKT